MTNAITGEVLENFGNFVLCITSDGLYSSWGVKGVADPPARGSRDSEGHLLMRVDVEACVGAAGAEENKIFTRGQLNKQANFPFPGRIPKIESFEICGMSDNSLGGEGKRSGSPPLCCLGHYSCPL